MSRTEPTEFTLANTEGGKRPTKEERKDDKKSERYHGSGTGFSQLLNKHLGNYDNQSTDSNN